MAPPNLTKPPAANEYNGLAGTLTRDDWDRLYAEQRSRIADECWRRYTFHWRKRDLKPPPRGLLPIEYATLRKALPPLDWHKINRQLKRIRNKMGWGQR